MRPGFNPWFGKIPWRREQLPTPVFLPREFHGQEPGGYSPWGHKESDMTKGVSDGTPLQYSCLENPMNRGAWGAIDHGVAKRRFKTEGICTPMADSC